MRRALGIVLVLVGLSSVTEAAINFSAGTGERVLEGIKFPQLIFRDNGRKVTYEQPRGWKAAVDASRIRFLPPDMPQAQAEIDQVPLLAPLNLDESAIKTLQQKALAGLPPGNQDAKVLLEERSPVKKDNNDSYGVSMSYRLNGQEFVTNVLYLNLPDALVRFRITALKADFEKVYRSFRGSVFTWQWTEPAAKAAAVAEQRTAPSAGTVTASN